MLLRVSIFCLFFASLLGVRKRASLAHPLVCVWGGSIDRCTGTGGPSLDCCACVLVALVVAACLLHRFRAWWTLHLTSVTHHCGATVVGSPPCCSPPKATTALHILSPHHHPITLAWLTCSGGPPPTRAHHQPGGAFHHCSSVSESSSDSTPLSSLAPLRSSLLSLRQTCGGVL